MSRGALLRQLLAEDGVDLKGRGAQRTGPCPFHDDTGRPNLNVDVERGLYKCFSCEAQGDVVDYLVKKRGLSKKEAIDRVKQDAGEETEPQPSREKGPKRAREIAPFATGKWGYYDKDGKLAFVVARIPPRSADERKKYWTYTPIPEDEKGNRWVIKQLIRKNRPLYRLRDLLETPPDRQVAIVEGEKCADAMRAAFDGQACVVSWPGGADGVQYADFRPLKGRKVLLIADEDTPGRRCMEAIADKLHRLGCTVKVVLPDGESHDDVADIVEAGGKKALVAHIEKWVRTYEVAALPDLDQPNEDGTPNALERNDFFEVLGNMRDMVLIRLWTSVLVECSRNGLQRPQQLGSIAPDMNWWCSTFNIEGLSNAQAQRLGMAIISIADRKGQINLDDILARGAALTKDGRAIWHLGDRLLFEGEFLPLHQPPDGRIYASGPPIKIGDITASPLSAEEKMEIAETMLRYRFKTRGDGQRMLGWIVSSIVGGALPWRPHLWLLGPTSVGKSWWIKFVLMPVLESLGSRLADWTAPSVARHMGSDSFPLLIDEAEPDRSQIKDVITLCRIAAGAEGARIRSEGTGQGISSQAPRFSALMSSVRLPLLEAADNNRFALVQFSSAGVPDWPALEADLQSLFGAGSETPQRIRTSIIAATGHLAQRATEISRGIMQSGQNDARAAMIQGALTAGWEWWMEDTDELVPIQMPRAEGIDTADVLNEILSLRLRTVGQSDTTILTILVTGENERVAVQFGLKKAQDGLLLDPSNPNLRRALRGSPFESVDLVSHMKQINGVTVTENGRRFDSRRARALLIPYSVLQKFGFAVEWANRPEDGDLYDPQMNM